MNTGETKRAVILPSQLRMARESLALTIDDAASLVGGSPEEVSGWEQGTAEPSIEQLWDIAEAYGRGTDYFLKVPTHAPASFNFRLTKKQLLDELSLGARQALVRFEELCRTATKLERIKEKSRQVRVGRANTGLAPEELAHSERGRLGLNGKPIPKLRDLLEDQGVRVFLVPVDPGEFSGFSWWHTEYGPAIMANALEGSGRRNFTIAHEYAHLLRSDPPGVCDLLIDKEEERFASDFAAGFLMPRGDVVANFQGKVGPAGTLPADDQFEELAGRYRVSMEAMSWRLESLGLVRRGTTAERVEEWKRRKPRFVRAPKGPKWKNRLGTRYVSLAVEAYSSGRISLGKLAQSLDLDVWQAYDVVEEERATASKEL